MKVDDLIYILENNKEFVKPIDVSKVFKIEEEESFEILKQAEAFGIAGNVLDHTNWKEKSYTKLPSKITNNSINEFQDFLNKNFPDVKKRLINEWKCLSCGTTTKIGGRLKKCSCGRRGGFKLLNEEKKEITFDYELKRPVKEIKTIGELKEIIIKNFPSIWFEVKACLGVLTSMSLKHLNGCPALMLVGNPSGEKTTAESFFYGHKNTYLSDDFTPKSFVSHSANVKEEDLGAVDLLPKVRNKVLISPELAPLFEGNKDRLIENFAILTRVLDGEGLNRDSGVHGHRGYSGDYKFGWIGGTTPLRASVWNVMGKIGNRLFFLNMREKNREDEDYLDMFRGRAYEEKVKECRGAVRSFLDNFYKENPIRSIEWDAEGDIFILQEIIKYAKLLSKLRATQMIWKGEEKGTYEYSFPIIEEPPRAINSLYNFAKGHALMNDRKFLRKEDLEIVKAIAFSSMPHDRFEFLKLLAKHEGKLTTGQIEKELNCSQDTALRTMKIFEILGVVTRKSLQTEYSGMGRPMNYVEINPEFKELLDPTQSMSDAINSKPQETKGVCDEKYNLNPQDFIKNQQKTQRIHPKNDEIIIKSQKINPVCDEKLEDSGGN